MYRQYTALFNGLTIWYHPLDLLLHLLLLPPGFLRLLPIQLDDPFLYFNIAFWELGSSVVIFHWIYLCKYNQLSSQLYVLKEYGEHIGFILWTPSYGSKSSFISFSVLSAIYDVLFEAKAKLNTIISKFEKVLQTKDDIDVLLSTAQQNHI